VVRVIWTATSWMGLTGGAWVGWTGAIHVYWTIVAEVDYIGEI